MPEVNWSTVVTIISAAIILGKQLQIIKQLSTRVEDLEGTVRRLAEQLTRFSTILEERTRPRHLDLIHKERDHG